MAGGSAVTDKDGNALSYTADVTVVLEAPFPVMWRLNCPTYSGSTPYILKAQD